MTMMKAGQNRVKTGSCSGGMGAGQNRVKTNSDPILTRPGWGSGQNPSLKGEGFLTRLPHPALAGTREGTANHNPLHRPSWAWAGASALGRAWAGGRGRSLACAGEGA